MALLSNTTVYGTLSGSGIIYDLTSNSLIWASGYSLASGINTQTGNYATITNLASTGSTLDTKINSLSGWSASEVNLTSTGVTLINNLFNTGSNLNTKTNDLSGYVNSQDNSISTNLYNTGNTLNNKINSLSGYTDFQDTNISSNLRTTGSTLDTKINNLSGYVNTQDTTISNNLTTTGSTLDNKINSLSGSSVLLYGNQTIGGIKTFRDNVYINNLYVTGDEFIANVINNYIESPYILLNLTGGAVDGGIFFVTGVGFTGINDYGPIIGFDHVNKFKFGVSTRNSDLSTLPDIASVQQIEAYSGVANNTFSTITNLASTGNTLEQKISSLSGTLTSTYATITNLTSTGSTLVSNLASTGSTLQTNINTVSSNLILTGSNLEGKINSLSGTLTSNYATITNLASTGSSLDSKINSLSGWSASAINLASTGSTLVTNLANTGSTLDTKINTLSGYVTGTNSTFTTNLAFTGSTLNTRINNLSGYINSSASNIVFTTGNQTISGVKSFAQDTVFGDSAQGDFLVISGNQFTIYGSGNFTSGLFVNGSPVLTGSSTLYATTVNLASTGSTLDTKIDNLSGVSVLRFGDQTISGIKTFIGNHNISGNLNVTGNSNIRGTLDVTGLVVSGLGIPFILKSPNNGNSVYFDPTLNGNAGILFTNYIATIGLQGVGDQNLSIGYGGGGTRNLIFNKMKTFLLVLLLATAALACSPNCNDCDPAASICFACAEGF
jgi:hypothetical protein